MSCDLIFSETVSKKVAVELKNSKGYCQLIED